MGAPDWEPNRFRAVRSNGAGSQESWRRRRGFADPSLRTKHPAPFYWLLRGVLDRVDDVLDRQILRIRHHFEWGHRGGTVDESVGTTGHRPGADNDRGEQDGDAGRRHFTHFADSYGRRL